MSITKKLALAGLLLAVVILLQRFFAVQTPIIRIGFGYVPIILGGWLLGPLWTGVIGAFADVLGMILMPRGAYFPGFTFSGFVGGFIYGVFLYNRPFSKKLCLRLAFALLASNIVVSVLLNTTWLLIITKKELLLSGEIDAIKKATAALLAPRLIKDVIELPIKFITMIFVIKLLEKPVNLYLRGGNTPYTGDAEENDSADTASGAKND